jgi:hypothetical protein
MAFENYTSTHRIKKSESFDPFFACTYNWQSLAAAAAATTAVSARTLDEEAYLSGNRVSDS